MKTNENTKSKSRVNNRRANDDARAKTRARNSSQQNVTLREIHDDIHRDNKNATITTKKMRVKLRREFRDVHAMNDAWTFSRRDYDKIRAMFDANYAMKMTRKRTTRATSSNVAKTSRERVTRVVNVDATTNDTNDAN
jgi:hypothetical protein